MPAIDSSALSLSKNWFLAQYEPNSSGLKMLPQIHRSFCIPIRQVRCCSSKLVLRDLKDLWHAAFWPIKQSFLCIITRWNHEICKLLNHQQTSIGGRGVFLQRGGISQPSILLACFNSAGGANAGLWNSLKGDVSLSCFFGGKLCPNKSGTYNIGQMHPWGDDFSVENNTK